jgi:hypothetical protein
MFTQHEGASATARSGVGTVASAGLRKIAQCAHAAPSGELPNHFERAPHADLPGVRTAPAGRQVPSPGRGFSFRDRSDLIERLHRLVRAGEPVSARRADQLSRRLHRFDGWCDDVLPAESEHKGERDGVHRFFLQVSNLTAHRVLGVASARAGVLPAGAGSPLQERS